MVAAVTVINGKAEMAYVGETPWHSLGQQLTPGMPLEIWAREAGMKHKNLRSKIRYAVERGADDKAVYKTWDAKHVIFRSDNFAPMGVVSEDYKVVQPIEILEFFRDETEKRGFQLETAGTLFGGKRYWALAKTGYELRVAGNDVLDGYLLLATSCDGSMATTAKFTSVRVVCNNTLTAALSGGKSGVSVRHSTTFKETEVKIELGLLDEAWGTFGEKANKLAGFRVTKQEALDVLISILGDPAKLAIDTASIGIEKALEAQPNVKAMGQIITLFDGAGRGSNLPSSKGTLWGLVNATTEFYDHIQGKNQSNRLAASWFGVNETRKLDIMDAALKMAA